MQDAVHIYLTNKLGKEHKGKKFSKEMGECGSERGKKDGWRFGRKCSGALKEYRGRFYIMRRCIGMLLCWHKYG